MKEMNERDVVASLSRVQGVIVNRGSKEIKTTGGRILGLKLLRKVDYLVKVCGYSSTGVAPINTNTNAKDERVAGKNKQGLKDTPKMSKKIDKKQYA